MCGIPSPAAMLTVAIKQRVVGKMRTSWIGDAESKKKEELQRPLKTCQERFNKNIKCVLFENWNIILELLTTAIYTAQLSQRRTGKEEQWKC